MKKELKEMWDECVRIIRDNITQQQFDTIFAYISAKSFQDGQLILNVPSKFVCEYVEEHYIDLMRKVITRVFGKDTKLGYSILVNQNKNISVEETSNPVSAMPARKCPDGFADVIPSADLDSRLFPRYTFDNFIEGDSNRLVRSVGLSIAKNPARTFNPLFIYGPSGCGKTHVLNAIGWAVKEQHPELRVLYLSAHLFTVQFMNAKCDNTINEFISFYQTIDVLLLDDIHELAGKKATQNTFFHIFNHLHLNNKQIILTADRPPIEIEGLEDRLLTRFKWGLQAEIEKPNKALCRAIVNDIVKKKSLPIPANVCNYIADKVNGSVRDIEGVINSLMAYSVINRCDVSMKLADQVLPKFVHIEQPSLTIADVKKRICRQFSITEAELTSQSRRQPLAQTRHIAIYLASKLTGMSNSQIGENMGGRSHATVNHSISYIRNLCETDASFTNQLEEIEEKVLHNM
ncbi:MAG: chromosomal replication initiator protein DnaA [Prevotellaceae bacterium]|nr:chromosomal replication initiator protein DnaA [Candidatus Colivivens caballi]